MKASPRAPRLWIVLAVALTGIGFCLTSIVRFFGRIIGNGLQWNEREFFQEHYLAVGDAYSQAFLVGFFLCFFLVMVAVAVGQHVERRRAWRQEAGA
ncbi:hypothetical protein ABI59_21355 [Acidobacteria bacterium Mor1]|nr:hypothetical protein ABI59_21355 [Acidobacteria bacterium Mor1]